MDTEIGLDEALLLQRWRDGDLKAADLLVQRHVPALRRYFQSRRVDAPDDLVQQTLLEVFRAILTFRGDASFRTFLFCVARHQLYAHYRSRRRVHALHSDPAAISCADESQREQEMASALEAGVLALPSELRRVIELAYWCDRTQADIAALLDIPSGTVASRMRRAKARLRAHVIAQSSRSS
ncbi:MAG TPA: sigma-70 family RNA polymerase sigma factor [Polyangiales bacterium]|jgi:RNA polymerase sigma-70 factor (ECF subfamily)|nr:sigma-70 family RNA polymerase sigma factor [Polyangiales bacterium]